jgi:hypothetical protein
MALLRRCADLARQRRQQTNPGTADDAVVVVDMADLTPLPLGRTIEIAARWPPEDKDDDFSSVHGDGSYGRRDSDDADISISVFDFARQQLPPLANAPSNAPTSVAAGFRGAAAKDGLHEGRKRLSEKEGLSLVELWPAVVKSAAVSGADKWLVSKGASAAGAWRRHHQPTSAQRQGGGLLPLAGWPTKWRAPTVRGRSI